RYGWVDLVQADLEMDGYAVGWADLPAACVGAPHRRQRLWFVADADGGTQSEGRGTMPGEAVSRGSHGRFAGSGALGELGDADGARSQGLDQRGHGAGERAVGPTGVVCGLPGFWSRAEWYVCRDGKARPVEPGIFPLADGVSGRVAVVRPGVKAETAIQDEIRWVSRAGALREAGNAIVPQVAAEVIRAYMEIRS